MEQPRIRNDHDTTPARVVSQTADGLVLGSDLAVGAPGLGGRTATAPAQPTGYPPSTVATPDRSWTVSSRGPVRGTVEHLAPHRAAALAWRLAQAGAVVELRAAG